MKGELVCLVIFLQFFGCSKEEFDPKHPDVYLFVKQLKTGSYSEYEKGENGENLWLQMPEFSAKHISTLIRYASDTSQIPQFPLNPISSRYPLPFGRDYFILGECLLWTVEGIRNGTKYGSLDPILQDITLPDSLRRFGLTGIGIMEVQLLYSEWWNNYKDNSWEAVNPLDGSNYRW
jgi:hypothetical protein